MDERKKSASAAAAAEHLEPAARAPLLRGESAHEVVRLAEGVGSERVVRPATLAAIGDEPRVLEHLEMEGEPRLRGVERLLQVADAALAVAQHLEHRQPRLVGEGVEEVRGAGEVERGGGGRGGCGHAPLYINYS